MFDTSSCYSVHRDFFWPSCILPATWLPTCKLETQNFQLGNSNKTVSRSWEIYFTPNCGTNRPKPTRLHHLWVWCAPTMGSHLCLCPCPWLQINDHQNAAKKLKYPKQQRDGRVCDASSSLLFYIFVKPVPHWAQRLQDAMIPRRTVYISVAGLENIFAETSRIEAGCGAKSSFDWMLIFMLSSRDNKELMDLRGSFCHPCSQGSLHMTSIDTLQQLQASKVAPVRQ